MRDAWAMVGMLALLVLSFAGLLYFGLPHDPDFDNPGYAACIRRGHARYDCKMHILGTGKAT